MSAAGKRRAAPKERSLGTLRSAVARADAEILRLIAHRLELAREIGRHKLERGLPIQDFGIERLVLERNRDRARSLGLGSETADDVSKMLIRHAVRVQDEGHEARRRAERPGRARRVLVVGGAGGMGRWLASYFDSFGDDVTIVDPKASRRAAPFRIARGLARESREAEVIAIAVPIGATAAVLRQVARSRTEALVFDIASLKTPVARAIERTQEAGLRVASVHPLFGPDATILSGRNIVFCRTAPRDFSSDAKRLFEDTTARLITVPIERHDEIMSRVLGLSHLVNLVFASTLASSGLAFRDLRPFGSTTFNSQLEVARRVVRENQDLYYEIQSENAFTPDVLGEFASSLERFSKAIAQRDRRRFKLLMEEAHRYLERARKPKR